MSAREPWKKDARARKRPLHFLWGLRIMMERHLVGCTLSEKVKEDKQRLGSSISKTLLSKEGREAGSLVE